MSRTADRPETLRMTQRECSITMTAMVKMLQLSVLRISRLNAVAEMAGYIKGRKRQDLTPTRDAPPTLREGIDRFVARAELLNRPLRTRTVGGVGAGN